MACWFWFEPRPVASQDVYVPAPPSVYVVAPPPGQPTIIAQPQVHIVEARDEGSSVLRYGVSGFFAGGLAGLGVGYLATDGARGSDAWRGLVLASGIGALTLAGLGVGLGVIDAAAERRPPPGRFVMRDAAYGTLLGAAFGAAVGGLVALESRRGSDALLGASIGSVSGLVFGGLIGVLEGRWRRHNSVVLSMSAQRDARGQRVLGPGIAGRF
jgi:hypothetical protein